MDPIHDLENLITKITTTDDLEQVIRDVYDSRASMRHPLVIASGVEEIIAAKKLMSRVLGSTSGRVCRLHNASFDPNTRKLYAHYSILWEFNFPVVSRLSSHTLDKMAQSVVNSTRIFHPPMTKMEQVSSVDALTAAKTSIIEFLVLYDLEPVQKGVTSVTEVGTKHYKIIAENVYWITNPWFSLFAQLLINIVDIFWVVPLLYFLKYFGGLNMQKQLSIPPMIKQIIGISTKATAGEQGEANYPWTIVLENTMKCAVSKAAKTTERVLRWP
ncbi:hypothetical protein MIR68_004488 [Amoeboaphelidium protococcarum]|nr:hypothetical protein MIR68_004488 [Amoeboaphelidium protococcarum]